MSDVSLTFVYGTLQAGERNHPMLGASRFLRLARTLPRFELIDLGEYPALLCDGQTAVEGELYEVPSSLLPVLDEFEGVPSLFVRVSIELDDGTKADAYVFAGEAIADEKRIASGSWREHSRVRKRPDTGAKER